MQFQLPDWAINLIILAIGTGIPVVYNWLTNKYIPSIQKEREGTQAFDQKTRGDAFTQVLDINKQLIEHVIGLSNGRFDRLTQRMDERLEGIAKTIDEGDKNQVEQLGKVAEAVNRMTSLLTEIKGQMGVVSRDWSRWSEIVSDIDQEMNTIKELIKALLVKSGIKPEPGG
jgi:DNA anti-recombination protein RmuC